MSYKSNKKLKKAIKIILLFIVVIVLFFILNPSEEDYLIKDLNKKSSIYLEECNNVNDNYLKILKIMYPNEEDIEKFIKNNITYTITDREVIDSNSMNISYMSFYVKVSINVKSYNYANAYKNAVLKTNEFINKNNSLNREAIQKYFYEQLEKEGQLIIQNNQMTTNIVYRCSKEHEIGGSKMEIKTYIIYPLPNQKNNMDLVNAMLGGLVEEMDRTKLPEGVDLEEIIIHKE
ncbi:hypothetical protein [Anaerofustis stercorihominis]|uniref:hypothetical protein n=1 Tax=Anaerofustis stercorihominis TaxID=214853 RepID=UPI00110698A5|nr:hypothetical protein [Anaerofustis stercorihominis]